jgi:hypothetical protein
VREIAKRDDTPKWEGHMRLKRAFGLPALALGLAVLTSIACSKSDSSSSPTGPETTATLTGTVVSGVGPTGGVAPLASPIGLAGVTVHVEPNGASTTTDGTGAFTLARVPMGSVDLSFQRADVHARGNVMVMTASLDVTAAIVGSNAVITPRGHAGAEIEGLVVSVDAAGSSLVVNDDRLGSVTVTVTTSTVIRHGNAPIALSAVKAGDRVHVKAAQQANGTYAATDVNVQNQGSSGHGSEVTGSVVSVDAIAKSFVVSTGTGNVTVTTTGSTKFTKNGAAATFSDVAAGLHVDVEGTTSATSFVADEVEIEG